MNNLLLEWIANLEKLEQDGTITKEQKVNLKAMKAKAKELNL